ncbi:MAG: serine protein kinase RIO [Candidatus Micrarchaeota archaeon]|nr:serine protein kinase RIO [Candidatus Micrarchaeota archaeon]
MWEIRKKFKDAEARKVFAGVLDESTLLTLYRLSNKGFFDVLYGFIKRGKESNIILAEKNGKKLAVKVHAVTAATFKRIHPYILGDPRFSGLRGNRRKIIFAWCRKEYRNMVIARKAGINCPEPLACMNNVLVMSFIGDEHPAPRLVDTEPEEPERIFERTIEFVKKLYHSGIVHGDLSAYNILYWKNEPWFIDFSQGVSTSHPNAEDFLRRDVNNVCSYFSSLGLRIEPEKVYEEVRK